MFYRTLKCPISDPYHLIVNIFLLTLNWISSNIWKKNFYDLVIKRIVYQLLHFTWEIFSFCFLTFAKKNFKRSYSDITFLISFFLCYGFDNIRGFSPFNSCVTLQTICSISRSSFIIKIPPYLKTNKTTGRSVCC